MSLQNDGEKELELYKAYTSLLAYGLDVSGWTAAEKKIKKDKKKLPKRSKPIRQKEFDALYAAAVAAKEWELCKVYALLFFCGFRISETLQFTPAQLRLAIEGGVLEAYISKQDIKREVPITVRAATLLSALLPRAHSLHNFVKPVCESHLTTKTNAHIRTTLGGGFTSHGFRRGYLSDILDTDSSDIGAKEVAAIVGHANTAMTALYYDPSMAAKRKRVERAR